MKITRKVQSLSGQFYIFEKKICFIYNKEPEGIS